MNEKSTCSSSGETSQREAKTIQRGRAGAASPSVVDCPPEKMAEYTAEAKGLGITLDKYLWCLEQVAAEYHDRKESILYRLKMRTTSPRRVMMATGVYRIHNVVDDSFYIGSTKVGFESRWKSHLVKLRAGNHHSKKLQTAWNYFGAECFSFEILAILESNDVVRVESRLLKKWFGSTLCYNESKHSSGPPPASPQLRRLRSEMAKKQVWTEERKKAMSIKMMGHPYHGYVRSKEHRVKKADETRHRWEKWKKDGTAVALAKSASDSMSGRKKCVCRMCSKSFLSKTTITATCPKCGERYVYNHAGKRWLPEIQTNLRLALQCIVYQEGGRLIDVLSYVSYGVARNYIWRLKELGLAETRGSYGKTGVWPTPNGVELVRRQCRKYTTKDLRGAAQ